MITPTPYEVRTPREPCRSVTLIAPESKRGEPETQKRRTPKRKRSAKEARPKKAAKRSRYTKEASIVACRSEKRQAPEARRKPTGAHRSATKHAKESAQERTGTPWRSHSDIEALRLPKER